MKDCFCKAKVLFILLGIFFIPFYSFSQSKIELTTDINLSGGFSTDSIQDEKIACISIDMAAARFGNFGIAATGGVQIGINDSISQYTIGLLIPGLDFSYFVFDRIKITSGVAFLSTWNIQNSTYGSLKMHSVVHSVGCDFNSSLSFIITRYLAAFARYDFYAYPWIEFDDESNDWTYGNQITAGISFKIPWNLEK